MGSQGGEGSWQGGGQRAGKGKVVADRVDEAVAGRVVGPTFACR